MGSAEIDLSGILERAESLTYTLLDKCRICGGAELTDVYRIPPQFLSPRFVETNEGLELARFRVPMTLTLCAAPDCGHLQLREEVEPDLLYREYFYRSATSDTMRGHLQDVVTDILARIDLAPGDIVTDIGSNDTTMLSLFPPSLRRTGFEPAQNIDWSGVDDNIAIINDYFSADRFRELYAEEKAKVLTCCAMFYDVGDPNDFVAQARSILADDGFWCIQLSYLPLMLENLNFYDICHEHLSYHTLDSLERLLGQNGLRVFDAVTNSVNGGSIRVFASHQAYSGHGTAESGQRLSRLRDRERERDLKAPSTFLEFGAVIDSLSAKLRDYIQKRHANNELVLGLGASTKGNVLIQLFQLQDLIPCISERNPDKVGLRTVGTDIELISEAAARDRNPACMLVLPWYFKDEIVERELGYLESGGTLLFPMPYPHIVNCDGEVRL